MDIFEHIPIPDEFKNLRRYERLLTPESRGVIGDECAFIRKDESFIALESSHAINRYIMMPNDLLLGYNFIWQAFDDHHWQRMRHKDAYQCGLWDLKTGKRLAELKGKHIGSPLGAQILDDKRLITWGDDFLLNVWDRNTGECLETMPVGVGTRSDYRYPEWDDDEKLTQKIWKRKNKKKEALHKKELRERLGEKAFAENMERENIRLAEQEENRKRFERRMNAIIKDYGNVPYVKSNTFSGWGDERRKAFVDDRQELSFNLKFILPKTEDISDTTYATYQGTNPDCIQWEKYSGHDIWDCFYELEGVNAGYSFDERLKDGRLYVTGEEYGVSDKAYIWDGGLNLTMLLLPMFGAYCVADGQQDDGAITYDEGDVKFYDY